MNFRRWSYWFFCVLWLLTWIFWFTHGVAFAEGPGKLSSSSENTAQQAQDNATTPPKADGDAVLKRAINLEQQGKYEEAIQYYSKVLEISPKNALAQNNLAWLLATCPKDQLRNGKKAVIYATRACETTKWKNSSTLDTLGAALAEDGQFQKAIELLTKFRAEFSEAEQAKFDRRMALFREGKPYRQTPSASSSSTTPSSDTTNKIDPELLTMLRKASALEQAGRLSEAAEQYGEMVERSNKLYGPDHATTVQLMVRQGDKYFYAGQHEKAASIFEKALPILRHRLPKDHGIVTYCVSQLATAYQQTKQYEKALQLNSENLAVREASLGKDHPHTLISLSNLATTHLYLDQPKEALRLLNEWLVRNERGQGEKNPGLYVALKMLATAHEDLENMLEAEKYFAQALEKFKVQKVADRLEEADIERSLAEVQREIGGPAKLDEARRHAQHAMEIAAEVCGENHWITATAKKTLALIYLRSNKFTEAESLLQSAVKISENSQGKDSPYTIILYFELARLYLKIDRADEAEKFCSRCVDAVELQYGVQPDFQGIVCSLKLWAEIAGRTGHQAQVKSRLKQLIHVIENRLGKEHSLFANVLMQAGEAYTALGSSTEAKASFTRCLEIQQAKLGPAHPDVAMTLHRLGLLSLRAARYAEAEPFYNKSLQIYQTSLGDEHWQVASVLNDLGFLYMRTGRYAESEKTFEEAARIAKKNQGIAAEDVLNVALSYWGRLCNETGRFVKAESLHKQSLPIAEEIYGRQSPNVAWEYVYLAQLYWSMEQYPNAERCYRQAIAIFENIQGKEHPDIYVPMIDLGSMLCSIGRYDEAEAFLQQSFTFVQNGGAINERNRVYLLENLAVSHLKQGHSEEVIRYGMEAQRAHRSLINHVLPGLSPAEQIAYLSLKWQGSFNGWLSVGLNLAKKKEAVDASAEWLLNGKALSTELLAEQVRLSKQSNDPALAATARELAEVRGQLAHLVLGTAQAADSPEKIQIGKKLAQRELELVRRLGQQTLSMIRESPWVTLNEVRKKLPAQSVLIEIAKFPVHHMNKDTPGGVWGSSRYVAWIIPPEDAGGITLIDLGDSERIDEAVAKCRQSIELFPQTVKAVGLKQATKIAMADTAKLSDLVWQPLEKATNNAEKLIISPDGGLWLYPWEALTDANKNFLVEKKQICYLVTGRQVVPRNTQKAGTTAAIFADPDYDAELPESKPNQTDTWGDMTQLLRDAGTTQGLQRLPNGAAEADLFATAVRHYMASKPSMYCGKKALESEFKKLQNPRMLIISTHGFFLPDQAFDNMPLTKEARQIWNRYNLSRFFGADQSNVSVVPNPLLRCGLILAGANRCHRSTDANDGVLTGLEILGTDFSGTELVVLSACETGVGAVRNAEGIVGLHYAFQLAGAKTVIATSWPVLIEPSTKLMQTFFDNLNKKQGKVEALRNAQVSLIKRMRETVDSVHPALWAGYTIIGGER